MNKVINGVATEYEIPEQRYLKCETLTGEWWYKDMKTGKDLPLFITPIPEREETKITYETGNIKELERITIDLLQELDKYKNIVDEVIEYIKRLEKDYDINVWVENKHWAYILMKLEKLKELKGE